MKIALVDDHEILLEGLIKILSSETNFDIVWTARTVEKALETLAQKRPDILITDYNLPDGDGLSMVKVIKRKYPKIKIIMLSMHDEAYLVKEILKEGINGYILKKDSQKELITAIYAVNEDKTFLSSDINQILVNNLHSGNEQKLLTDRERDVLKLIVKEYTNKQIAEELFISERTVETHRKNIFRKTGNNTLVGVIKFAYANNLV